MSENSLTPSDEFIQLLTNNQTQLRGIIMAALGNYADCQDVLQRTNLTIWKKSVEFAPNRSFLAWAIGVARYEILAFIRDRRRERIIFTPEVAELLVTSASDQLQHVPERQLALRECIAELPDTGREVLHLKYLRSQRIDQISVATGRSIDGVKSLLVRLRKLLAQCIERRLAAQL